MAGLDHERLEVYRMAIALVVEVAEIAREIPRGHAHIVDQLLRAVTSIPLNIAEGTGEFRGREKARFYRMARRSATECSAILDVLVAMKLVAASRIVRAKTMIEREVAMLIRLGESVERAAAERTRPRNLAPPENLAPPKKERTRERARARARAQPTDA